MTGTWSVPGSTASSITKYQLVGHAGPVLCLDYIEDSLLLSGSEDHTGRVWDLRTDRTAVCCHCDGEVLSAVFGPNLQNETSREIKRGAKNENGISSPEHSVYLAVANSVYLFDLRKAGTPVQQQEIHSTLVHQHVAEDEINQIIFSSLQKPQGSKAKQQKKDLSPFFCMASCNDAGTINISELFCSTQEQKRVVKNTLTHGEIVTSIAFRPSFRKRRRLELASGGTDQTVLLWDVSDISSRQGRVLSSYFIPTQDEDSHKICNPPMVHSLEWSPTGRLLVAGLGDGSCAVFSIENGSLVLQSRLENAHSGSIASICFPLWMPGTTESPNSLPNERLLITSGNDGMVVAWDLEKGLCGEDQWNPQELFPMLDSDNDTSLGELSLTVPPRTLFAFSHGRKPNWMTYSLDRDPCYPRGLFIADTSCGVSIYRFR